MNEAILDRRAMTTSLRGAHAMRMFFLLLVSGLYSTGCAHDFADDSPRPTGSGWVIGFAGSGSAPAVADGVLYVGSADGAVYALDARTGQRRWGFQTGEGLSSAPQMPGAGESIADMVEKFRREGSGRVDMTPAIENGTVFVGSGDRSFYAIDAATGKRKWSYLAGLGMASQRNTIDPVAAPVIRNGTVFFTTEGSVHALDAATGEKRWKFETWEGIPKGPVLVESSVFVTASGLSSSNLYAFVPETGATKWTTTLDGSNVTAPLAAKGLVLVAAGSHSGSATLHAINAVDGTIRWKLAADRMYGTSQLLVAQSAVYFSTGKRLIAADLETGRQLWSFKADEIYSDLGADGHNLYFVTHQGSIARPDDTLHALALTTGHPKWSQGLSGGAYLHLVHEGVVYAGRRYLYAIDGASGNKLWSFDEIGRGHTVGPVSGGRIFVSSPTVDYFGTGRESRGRLYAIDTRTGKY